MMDIERRFKRSGVTILVKSSTWDLCALALTIYFAGILTGFFLRMFE